MKKLKILLLFSLIIIFIFRLQIKYDYNPNSNYVIGKIIDYKVKENFKIEKQKYNIGEQVKLGKGTLLHGTYRNLDGVVIR